MARCGCNTAMSTTCDAIMSCVAANLGRGLDYNEATRQIELHLSTDAGNTATVGTDEGFYAPAPTATAPMTWPKTVATLPAQAIAALGGGTLVGPATSPDLIEYAIAHDIDIYASSTYLLADGVPYEQVGPLTQDVNAYTDNPGGVANRYLSSLTAQQLNYDAGTRVNPTGRNTGAPTSFLSPDGGWGGFYAPQYKPRTVTEMLRQVRGRMVVALAAQREGSTQAQIEAQIRAVVRTVVEAGAQEWVIVYVPGLLSDDTRSPLAAWVPIVTGAGITAGVSLVPEHEQVDPVWTPAEIVATGASWVGVRGGSDPNAVTEARITALVGAGLEVQVDLDGRQYWVARSFGLGVRAVRVPDAVYARGATTHPKALAYRRTMIPGLATRTPDIGTMTPKTATQQAIFNAGFARADQPGRWFPPGYGWVSGIGVIRNHQLLGTICPLPNATNYRLRIRGYRVGATVSGPELSLFFGFADDRDFSHLSGQNVKSFMNGYRAVLRAWSGTGSAITSRIFRVTSGLQTAIATANDSTRWRPNEWVSMSVTVTPTGVSLTVTDSAGSNTITSSDTTYRGPYAFVSWDDQSGTYLHGYDNPTDLVMYEALS